MVSPTKKGVTPLALTAELIPAGLAGKALSKLLPSSVWARLRMHVIEQAGSCCEICHGSDEPLHAHEVWQYVDPADTPWLDPEAVTENIAAYLKEKQRRWEEAVATLGRGITPTRVRSYPKLPPTKPVVPKVAILDRVQALCRLCHLCKHYKCVWNKPQQLRGGAGDIMRHWCRVNKQTQSTFIEYYKNELNYIKNLLIVKIEYCGYDELGDFKSVADWQDAHQKEAELYDEDFTVYEFPPVRAGS